MRQAENSYAAAGPDIAAAHLRQSTCRFSEGVAWKESSDLLSAGPPHQHDDDVQLTSQLSAGTSMPSFCRWNMAHSRKVTLAVIK